MFSRNTLATRFKDAIIVAFIVFFAVIMVMSALLYYQINNDSQDILTESIVDKLYASARVAAMMVDPVQHEKFQTIDDMDTTEYHHIIDKLRLLVSEAKLTYVYTLRKSDGQVYFVLDSDPDKAGSVGEPYPDYPRNADKVFSGESAHAIEQLSDKWGNFITAIVPLKDASGKIIAVVCVDYSDDFINELKRMLKQSFILQTTVTVMLFILLLFLLLKQLHKNASLTERIKLSEERHRLAVDGVQDAIFELSPFDNSVFVSRQFADMVGVPALPETIGYYRFLSLFNQSMSDRLKKVFDGLEKGKSDKFTFEVLTESPRQTWLLLRGMAMRNENGELIRINGAISDVSERKRLEETINRMAYFDTLTDLANRAFLMDQLNRYVKQGNPAHFALFFIDLDNFKSVNDNAGHEAGDRLLKAVASYLLSLTGAGAQAYRPASGNLNMVARLGGDEFVIILPIDGKSENPADFANRLVDGFAESDICSEKENFQVTMSVGGAMYPEHGQNVTELIKYADMAMYYAKRQGKNSFRMFNTNMLDYPMGKGMEKR